MKFKTENERLDNGLCPKCETDLEKASSLRGHSDDKTGTCPKCRWRDEV